MKTALIIGATGLVGRQLLEVLLKNDYYSEILIVGRRSVGLKDNRIKELLIDFDQLDDYASEISAHDYYCSVGTTMKKAKTKEAFMKVDYTYPIKLAEHGKSDPKFERFLLVSSYGANADSALFYNEVKGKTEEALKEMHLKSLLIFQPSLLIGYRDEIRPFEEAAKMVSSVLSFFIIGTRLRLWAIKGSEVARAMFVVAKRKDEESIQVFKPHQMIRIASAYGL